MYTLDCQMQTWWYTCPVFCFLFVPFPVFNKDGVHLPHTHAYIRTSLLNHQILMLLTNTARSFGSCMLKLNPCPTGLPLQWPNCVVADWRLACLRQRWLADCLLANKLTRDPCDNEWPSWICIWVSQHDLLPPLLSGQGTRMPSLNVNKTILIINC